MSKISKVSKRQQLKHQLQEQMLSNYYLSRYQVHMSKLTNEDNSYSKQKITSPLYSSNNPNRQFYSRKQYSTIGKPLRKNFKEKLRKQKQQNEKVKKQAELFNSLSRSLQKQLNSRVPTKIQNGSYQYIEIVEEGTKSRFKNHSQEKYHPHEWQNHQNNCYIAEQSNMEADNQNQDSLNTSRKKNTIGLLTNQLIEEKIKANLSKKFEYSPGRSSRSSPSKSSSKHNSPTKSIGGKKSTKRVLSPSQILQQNLQEGEENINLNESLKKKSQHEGDQRIDHDQQNHSIDRSTYSETKSINELKVQHINSSSLKKSRFGKSSKASRQMQNHRRLSMESVEISSEKKSFDRKDQPSLELRESTHDISNISRFSMNSQDGILIRQYLCQQLDQNQFGPYQNALISLRELIDKQPKAWPIFVVGQRILEDRKQYERKKAQQQQTIEKLQKDILRIKKSLNRSTPKNKNIKIYENQRKILKLVRKLGSLS